MLIKEFIHNHRRAFFIYDMSMVAVQFYDIPGSDIVSKHQYVKSGFIMKYDNKNDFNGLLFTFQDIFT